MAFNALTSRPKSCFPSTESNWRFLLTNKRYVDSPKGTKKNSLRFDKSLSLTQEKRQFEVRGRRTQICILLHFFLMQNLKLTANVVLYIIYIYSIHEPYLIYRFLNFMKDTKYMIKINSNLFSIYTGSTLHIYYQPKANGDINITLIPKW